jgi:adenine-specific DNA glycosylase
MKLKITERLIGNSHNITKLRFEEEKKMNRDELKKQIDELMRQYANEEIDGDTYAQKMMELTTSARNENEND